MKRAVVIVCVILVAAGISAAHATLGLLGGSPAGVVVAYDTYGGVTNVNCTNPNGTSYFGLATVASHKVLCDPAGHPYFGRGFYVFDFASLGNDESGNSYNTYVTIKYGNPPNYNWDAAEVSRMKAWGFNMIGPESTSYAMAWHAWVPSGTNPNKVPFISTEDACFYSWSNSGGYATRPIKDVLSVSSPNWHGTGYYGYGGVTDYEDPEWTTFADGEIAADGANGANATDKSYLIGVIGCDNDYTHGFNAGPDYDTSPTTGTNDFRLSYEVALGSPVEWASTHQHQIYTDSTVYNKKSWYTELTGKYANIAALNTAWGSSYTTFGTSGTCYGSGFAVWICPTSSAATSVGTGDGTTLTFTATLNTTVSANSLGIFVAGTLVGGDGGNGHFSGTAGTIYGPHLSGTINYTTGALSITFAAGNAPANLAAITAEYIANGWGVGSGVMDEDGRAAHQTWTGTNSVCIDGVGTANACAAGGGSTYASAGMVTDLNAFDVTLATQYAQTYKNAITTNLPGALFLGMDEFGTSNVPPDKYVIQGLATHMDIGIFSTSGSSGISQSELDYIHTWGGDLALGFGSYNTANADSPFAWPATSCTHSGTTVTCTMATPQNFSTASLMQTSCTDTTYNVSDIHPASSSGATLTYTASATPSMSSTTCNVYFYDGGFTTQAARASALGSLYSGLPAQAYTADGVHPFVMAVWWQWSDKQNEELDWGLVDTRDNAFNGADTTTATPMCLVITSYSCGGELRSGWGADDGITPLKNANTSIDQALAAY